MASFEREKVVADLWALPSTDGMTVAEWREAASAGERLPLPDAFRFEAVDAGGVEAQWAWWDGTAADGPVIVLFHGGGWVVCSIGTHRVLGGRLAGAADGRTLVVGYRLAPEHPFPVPVEDCAAAYRWLLGQGVDPGRVAFVGDSAGGNLVVAVALALKADGVPLPAALVAVSPAADLTFRGASNVDNRPPRPVLPHRRHGPDRRVLPPGPRPDRPVGVARVRRPGGPAPAPGDGRPGGDPARRQRGAGPGGGGGGRLDHVRAGRRGVPHLAQPRRVGARGRPLDRPHRALRRRALLGRGWGRTSETM